ncbi:hypothetical protein J3A83DRAFT_4112582, partial [Scleroderma citrinum]
EAAWQYSHQKLLLLDRTFGISSTQSLLFIGMVVDNDQKGIPIVFFHFMACKFTQAAHANYDGRLLEDLLRKWKSAMGKNSKGKDSDVKVVLTDNDTCKCNALAKVYPMALLLLCPLSWSQRYVILLLLL